MTCVHTVPDSVHLCTAGWDLTSHPVSLFLPV